MKRKNGYSSSSFFAPAKKSFPVMSFVPCPSCASSVSLASMNVHLDKCLQKQQQQRQRQDSSSSYSRVSSASSSSSTDFVSRSVSSSSSSSSSNSEKDKSSEGDELQPLGERMEKGPIPGLVIIKDFLSIEEGDEVVKLLESEKCPDWEFSNFNGNCLSKMYGYRTQWGLPNEERLVRINIPENGEPDIPLYLQKLVSKFHALVQNENPKNVPPALRNFTPNECNANKYMRSKKHYLTPHFDDRILSGPVLMNLSLAGDGYMTYCDKDEKEVDVFLPMNCLQLVTGKSRYSTNVWHMVL